jgi:hypothetical protein
MHTIAVLAVAVTLIVAPSAQAQTVVARGVADDATDANSQQKIGIDSRGKAYLTFVKPAGGVGQIVVASSRDLRRWEEYQVTHATIPSRYPALAVGPDDTVHLAWTQYDAGIGKVYYARYDGRRWSAPVKVSPGEAYAGVPALAVDTHGTVHLVWYGIRPEAPVVKTRHGSVYEILYTAFRDVQWLPPELISPGIPDAVNPSLALDDLGRLHSAWYQFDLRTYQARHTMSAGGWTPPRTISSGRDDALGVSLATGPQGTVEVVWERRETGGSRVYFAEFRQRWSGQQQISPPAQNAFHPTVAVDDAGRLYVAWDSDGVITLRRRDDGWQDVERVSADGKNTQPVLGASQDTVLLAWTQSVAGESRIQLFTVAGTRYAVPPPRARSPWGLLTLLVLLLGAAWLWTRRRRPAVG